MKIKDFLLNRKVLFNFKGIFIKNFMIIIVAITVPLLIANVAIYKQTTGIVQREAREANMNMLWKTSKAVDLVFEQINHIIPQVAKDPEVLSAIIDPDDHNITRNLAVIAKIRSIAISNDYIHSIYVYSANDQSILSSGGSVMQSNEFFDLDWIESYESHFVGTKQMDTRSFEDRIGKEVTAVTLLRNIPFESWSKQGAVVINISEEKLFETIKGMDNYNRGKFLVLDTDGSVVAYEDQSLLGYDLSNQAFGRKIIATEEGSSIQRIDDEEVLMSYVKSPYNKWIYVYMIPLSELYKDSFYIFRIIILITMTNIFIGFLISYLISKKIYRPINKLITLIDSKTLFDTDMHASKDEYLFLDQAYNFVLDKNFNMQNSLNTIKPMVKEKLFFNLLMGRKLSVQELKNRLNLLGIDFTFESYIVFLIQIDDYSKFLDRNDELKRNLLKIHLIEIVEKYINDKYIGVCVEIEANKLAAVVNYTLDVGKMVKENEFIEYVEIIRGAIEKFFPFTVTIGVGRSYNDLVNVHLSFDEADQALMYKIYQGKNEIINIGSLNLEEGELYFYNSEKEKVLVNNIRIGNSDVAIAIINELFEAIILERTISCKYVQRYFIRLINLIFEVIMSMGIELEIVFGEERNVYEEIKTQETVDDIREWFIDICTEITKGINAFNLSKSNVNISKICDYVEMNFSKDISLNDAAAHVGLSSSYVSTIFKESIGESFVSYLNRKRIEKSKQLIQNTLHTIKEIGFKVGFNSMQTFFRTFKKYEGITPGQYRDNHGKVVDL